MNNMTLQYNGATLYRVTKRQARKLFEQGYSVYIKPCNMNPENIFCDFIQVGCGHHYNPSNFDEFVHVYEIYNCNSEVGRYCSFYHDLLESEVNL